MKKFLLITIIFFLTASTSSSIYAQILRDHTYLKINDEVVNTVNKTPFLLTELYGDFIYDKILEVNQDVEISIDSVALQTRFKDSGLTVYSTIRSNVNFLLTTTQSSTIFISEDYTSYTFDRYLFNFSFQSTGTYELNLILYNSAGRQITSESYLLNVGVSEPSPEILINNIKQIGGGEILELKGNEILTFDTNQLSDQYKYIWGNSRDVYSFDKSFTLDLSKSIKPSYIVLRIFNNFTHGFNDNFITFEYAKNSEYIITPAIDNSKPGYDVAPPEIQLEEVSSTTVLIALIGLSTLVIIISYAMFRFAKSGKINT